MEQDLVIPTYQSQASEENYEGATVIDPIKGIFSQAVHDFSLTSFFQLVNNSYICTSTRASATSVADPGFL
jgi:DNA polymerase delta subunit 1